MTESIIKKRKLKLDKPGEQKNIQAVSQSLSNREGIISVDIDSRKKMLSLKYDLGKIRFETIEKMVADLGLGLSRRLTQRFKRGMAKFTEQNELDHLNAPVSSCCDDPKENTRHCEGCMMQGKNF